MKRKQFLVLATTLISSVSLGVGVIAINGASNPIFTSFANGGYNCELPNSFVELSTIFEEIIENGTTSANTHSFRGTVTKRSGDQAFIQRVNQVTHQIDGLRIRGLNNYGDDIEEGNVVDFSSGKTIYEYTTPTYIMDETTSYTISYDQNPYVYSPI